MSLLALFIEYPWLALLPAVGFVWLYRATGHGRAAAILWALYGIYEYGMKARWLCSGECNIRVDLLLIYPFLIVISAGTVWRGLRSGTHN